MLIHAFSRRTLIFLYLYFSFDIEMFVPGALCSIKYLLHVSFMPTAYKVILSPDFKILCWILTQLDVSHPLR